MLDIIRLSLVLFTTALFALAVQFNLDSRHNSITHSVSSMHKTPDSLCIMHRDPCLSLALLGQMLPRLTTSESGGHDPLRYHRTSERIHFAGHN